MSEKFRNFAANLVKNFDMGKFSRKKMQNFSVFYEKLKKRSRKTAFRDEVMSQLGWKYSTFYYKMKTGNIYVREADSLQTIMDQFAKR